MVGLADYHSVMCDHFGCGDGPFTAAFETTIEANLGIARPSATRRRSWATPYVCQAVPQHRGMLQVASGALDASAMNC